MKTIITYITDDGKEFNNQFEARRHECELTEHNWEFYNKGMMLQKVRSEETRMKFCKNCSKQELVNR